MSVVPKLFEIIGPQAGFGTSTLRYQKQPRRSTMETKRDEDVKYWICEPPANQITQRRSR